MARLSPWQDNAGCGVPHQLPEQPPGSTSAPPTTTGGAGEMSFSVSSSASRFCIREASSSARRAAIWELSRALGLAGGFLLLQVCRPVVPVLNFCGQAFLYGFGGLVQQLLLPGFHLGKMLGQ